MKTTCAILIEVNDSILIGHVTGKNFWSLPKGCLNKGETFEECAKRECLEETNLDLNSFDLIDLGMHNYLKDKNFYLFKISLSSIVVENLKCNTYFKKENGKELPEFDYIKLVSKDKIKKYINNKQYKIIEKYL